jgi:hypothetical protein
MSVDNPALDESNSVAGRGPLAKEKSQQRKSFALLNENEQQQSRTLEDTNALVLSQDRNPP